MEERIRIRAYELYLQREMADGHSEEDWFQAEREMQQAAAPQMVTRKSAA
jgi:hypothetical protein